MFIFYEGKTHEVQIQYERQNEYEIIEGDTFKLSFLFHNLIFNTFTYKLNAKPPGDENRCELNTAIVNKDQFNHVSLYDNNSTFAYTKVVELRFKNTIPDCSYNYSIEIQQSSNEYFYEISPQYTPKNVVMHQFIKVLGPVKPYFLDVEG